MLRLLRSLARSLGIAATAAFPPDSGGYRALQRLSRLLPAALRTSYASDPVAAALHHFAAGHDDVFFVQVGAHDGGAGDPIALYVRRDRWSGILVEPVRSVFARLQDAYRDRPDLALENVAVGDTDGTATFWHLRDEARAVYPLADQLGSFDRDVLLSHANRVPDIGEYLVSTEVPCVTFETLLERNGVERIDLLHLDTEGHDAVLLQAFPWQRFLPEIVVYEHKHLDAEEAADTAAMLRERGYELVSSGSDTLARHRGSQPLGPEPSGRLSVQD